MTWPAAARQAVAKPQTGVRNSAASSEPETDDFFDGQTTAIGQDRRDRRVGEVPGLNYLSH